MQKFSFLSYNVFLRPFGVTMRGNDRKNERCAEIAGRVLPCYDVVCLQEAFATLGGGRVDSIRRALVDRDYTVVTQWDAAFHSNYMVDSGLLIASRLAVDRVSFHEFEATGGGLGETLVGKGVLYAALCTERKQRVHVFVTHLNSERPEVRRSQLAELIHFVKRAIGFWGEAAAPLIVCGDFNIDTLATATANSNEIAVLRDAAERLALKDGLSARGLTYGSGDPFYQSTFAAATPIAPQRIDHVLSRGLVRTNERIELGWANAGAPYRTLSDHAGVAVEMSFNPSSRVAAGAPVPLPASPLVPNPRPYASRRRRRRGHRKRWCCYSRHCCCVSARK